MRGRVFTLVFLISLSILFGFGSSKINTTIHSIKPTPTPSRQIEIINAPVNVESVSFNRESVPIPCPYKHRFPADIKRVCPDYNEEMQVEVTTVAKDEENDVLVYEYEVSGGRIIGQGAKITWELKGVQPGIYTIKVGADDGCGICGRTVTRTIEVHAGCECHPIPDPCACPAVTVGRSTTSVKAGDTVIFTAKLAGGSQGDTVQYLWSISSGTIVEGQGTSEIKVKTNREMSGELLTATVEISAEGLCADCEKTASESVPVVKSDNLK